MLFNDSLKCQTPELKAVNGDEDLLMVTSEGVIIRINLETVGVYGRSTQGVRLINVKDDQTLKTVAVVEKEEIVEE